MRPTLTLGSAGPSVVEAQSKLNLGVTSHARLDVDGLFGPMTGTRVREFQRQKQLGVDGVVGPATWAALDALAEDGNLSTPEGVPPQVVTVPPTAASAGSLRERIIEIAMSQASPEPGVVSDLRTIVETINGQNRTVRAGWRQLKRYFDEAVEGWSEGNWTPVALHGIQTPGSRIPLDGMKYEPPNRPGVSWCGIFATWVLQQAGLPVRWRRFSGVIGVPKISGSAGMQPGDIAVQTNTHHFIVTGIQGNQVMSINGNSDFQSILVKPQQRSSIQAYYRAE